MSRFLKGVTLPVMQDDVDELVVAQTWKRRGVGRALMTALTAWSPTSALDKLSLAVYADNAPAIALYRAFGFVELKRGDAQIERDAIGLGHPVGGQQFVHFGETAVDQCQASGEAFR